MADPFQSKPPVKMPKAAKTVSVKSAANSADAVSATTINSIALAYIRDWKRTQATRK